MGYREQGVRAREHAREVLVALAWKDAWNTFVKETEPRPKPRRLQRATNV